MRIPMLAAAVSAAFLLPLAAAAVAGAQECVPLAAVEVAAAEAGAGVVHDLRGDDARAWLAAYNAVPPVTAIAGDQVLLLERAGAPTVLVVVLDRGCVAALFEEGRALVGQVTDRVLPGV